MAEKDWNTYSVSIKWVLKKTKGQCQECRNMFFDTETKDLFLRYEGTGDKSNEVIQGALCGIHSQAWLQVSAGKFIDDIGNMGSERLSDVTQRQIKDDSNSMPHERASGFAGKKEVEEKMTKGGSQYGNNNKQ